MKDTLRLQTSSLLLLYFYLVQGNRMFQKSHFNNLDTITAVFVKETANLAVLALLLMLVSPPSATSLMGNASTLLPPVLLPPTLVTLSPAKLLLETASQPLSLATMETSAQTTLVTIEMDANSFLKTATVCFKMS
jgi:hypothetical protein